MAKGQGTTRTSSASNPRGLSQARANNEQRTDNQVQAIAELQQRIAELSRLQTDYTIGESHSGPALAEYYRNKWSEVTGEKRKLEKQLMELEKSLRQ